jgi:hypothetical protein
VDERALRLATAILLSSGQISINDIEALPFVPNREVAWSIARELQRRFDTEVAARHLDELTGAISWEDVIVLRTSGSALDTMVAM